MFLQLGETNPNVPISASSKTFQFTSPSVQTHYDPTALPLDRTMHFCSVRTKKTAQTYKKRGASGVIGGIGETAAGQEGKWSHC